MLNALLSGRAPSQAHAAHVMRPVESAIACTFIAKIALRVM